MSPYYDMIGSLTSLRLGVSGFRVGIAVVKPPLKLLRRDLRGCGWAACCSWQQDLKNTPMT